MSITILVTYATRYGSTKETAEKIAGTLREFGFRVDLEPVREVHSLAGYQAIVLGAPIEIGRWHGDARRFLSENRRALAMMPVAVFALGPLHRDESEIREARGQFDKELAKFDWFKPAAIQVFVGRFDPTKLSFPASLFMGKIPASDEMDWEAIRVWAKELPAALELEKASAGPVLQVI